MLPVPNNNNSVRTKPMNGLGSDQVRCFLCLFNYYLDERFAALAAYSDVWLCFSATAVHSLFVAKLISVSRL